MAEVGRQARRAVRRVPRLPAGHRRWRRRAREQRRRRAPTRNRRCRPRRVGAVPAPAAVGSAGRGTAAAADRRRDRPAGHRGGTGAEAGAPRRGRAGRPAARLASGPPLALADPLPRVPPAPASGGRSGPASPRRGRGRARRSAARRTAAASPSARPAAHRPTGVPSTAATCSRLASQADRSPGAGSRSRSPIRRAYAASARRDVGEHRVAVPATTARALAQLGGRRRGERVQHGPAAATSAASRRASAAPTGRKSARLTAPGAPKSVVASPCTRSTHGRRRRATAAVEPGCRRPPARTGRRTTAGPRRAPPRCVRTGSSRASRRRSRTPAWRRPRARRPASGYGWRPCAGVSSAASRPCARDLAPLAVADGQDAEEVRVAGRARRDHRVAGHRHLRRRTSPRRCRTCSRGPTAPFAEESMTLSGSCEPPCGTRSVPSSEIASPVIPRSPSQATVADPGHPALPRHHGEGLRLAVLDHGGEARRTP